MRIRRGKVRQASAVAALIAVWGAGSMVLVPATPAAALPSEPPVIYVNAKPSADRLPRIAASSWVLADADTGEILAAKDPHHQYPPASTIKVLTAVTLMPHLDLDSTYSATLQDVNQPGTRIGLRAGMSNKVSDLFAGMLMNSGNDAASAVANAAGGWDPALRLMNEEAARLGAKDTVAATPNGLDRNEQVTSATDLAIFFREALKNPDIAKIFQTKKLDAQTINGRLIHLYNHNKMLQLNYPGHLGAKTGTTSMAGKTVVSAFKRGNRTLIVALMRYGSTMARASKPLYDWGFANAKKIEPVGQLPTVGPRPPVTARPALQVDENGTPKSGQDDLLAAVAPTASESQSSGSMGAIGLVAFIGLAVAAGLGFVRWRSRQPSA